MIARLNSRSWVLAGVAAGLLILIAAWLLVLSPVRSDAGQLRDSAAGVQTQNVVLLSQNNKLRDQAKHQNQLVAELDAALAGLPSGAGLPVFSRQLATQATARGLVLTGVTIGAPTAPVSTAAVAAAPAATDPGADASAATSTTVAPPTSATPSATQPEAIPITITSTGPALQQLLFLRDVQQVGPRLALVTSTALSPAQGATDTGSIEDNATMTLQLSIFTNPLSKTTRDQLADLTQSAAKG